MKTQIPLPAGSAVATHDNAALAIVLLSRGGAYCAGATELTELADRLHATLATQGQPLLRVQPAFVDRSQPTLPEALDLCAAAQTIVILPVMVPDEPSLRRWLHKLILRWHAERAGAAAHCPRLVFAEPLLQAPQLADVLARTVQSALAQPDVATVVGNGTWQHDPAGWSEIPPHQHHLLWCTGPRCAAKGALQLWPHLSRAVRESPGLKKKVMLLQTSCQYPCNHGPLMIAYPSGTWFGHLDAAAIDHIIDAQLNPALVEPQHVVFQPGQPEICPP